MTFEHKNSISFLISALSVTVLYFAPTGLMRAQSTADWRLVYMKQGIQREIGPFLTTLSLDPTIVNQIYIDTFLLERSISAADAIDLAKQQSLAPEQMATAIASARAVSDSQITSTFDPDTAPLVREIVRNYVGYSQIDQIFKPAYDHRRRASYRNTDSRPS